MYRVDLHKRINQITSVFYWFGLWHQEDESNVRQTKIQIFYFIYYLLIPVSLLSGAVSNDNLVESIFLGEAAIISLVVLFKMFYIIWKKKEIIELLHEIGVHSIKCYSDATLVNRKLKTFMNFVTALYCYIYFASFLSAVVIPFIGCEKRLVLDIGFPFDYKNNEIAYWIAFSFMCTEIGIQCVVFLFSIVTWYIMINCSIRYEILGNQLRRMGAISSVKGTNRNSTETEKKSLFINELIVAIQYHQRIKEYVYLSRLKEQRLRISYSNIDQQIK